MKNNFKEITIKKLNDAEQKRMDELVLWFIINQYMTSKVANPAPMGTSIPHMMGSLIKGVNPNVIEYAYNTLDMAANKPSTQEIAVMAKYKKIPARKSSMSIETYYKWLTRWVAAGQPIAAPILAELQHIHIRKFIKSYQEAFLGRNLAIAEMEI